MERFGPLCDPAWLADHRGEPDLRTIDVRWRLGGPPGRQDYLVGHIPSAAFLDVDGDLSGGRSSDGLGGRHPLPSAERFAQTMRRAGVNCGDRVVAYDDAGGSIAARLWWLLRHFGGAGAAVLDGGLQAWPGPLEAGEAAPIAGNYEVGEAREDDTVAYEQVRALHPGSVLLDARSPDRFSGEVEPVDPRAGHIPGAVSAFWKHNLVGDGRFLPVDELRLRLTDLGAGGADEVVCYCGSGVTACHNLLALEVAGLPGALLYPGSWSDWSSRPEAPASERYSPRTVPSKVRR